MRNPTTGHRSVELDGKHLIMRFNWQAIAEIEANYGDNPNLFEIDIIANVAAAGLREHHPEYTAERILQLSPPLIPFVRAVQDALQIAYFGAEAVPEDAPAEVKKNRVMGGLSRLIKRLFRRG